ncbi:MAG TPA: bifunctional nuclease family protein [Gemmatimonadaceae bacterium]|jgi:bifunctional DNase/RNase
MVEVKVARLGLDSTSNSYVVILQEKEGERLLPIWIGQPEAESIVMEMNHIQPPRPLTHDLCKRLIVGMGASLAGVHITRVQDNTYFAELQLQRGDDKFQIDARPSDSIAIALRLAAPIFAQESLLTAFAVEDGEEESATSDDASFLSPDPGPPDERDLSAEQLKSHLEKLRPEDFGKFNP